MRVGAEKYGGMLRLVGAGVLGDSVARTKRATVVRRTAAESLIDAVAVRAYSIKRAAD